MECAKDKLRESIKDLEKVIDDNPCGMGNAMFAVLCVLIKEFIKHVKGKRYLSTEEAAYMLGISPRTLRRRVKDGDIPPPKHYGHWEVSYKREDIEAYLERKKTAP